MTQTEMLAQSFARLPFTRRALHDALRAMGPDHLLARSGRAQHSVDTPRSARMRAAWQPDNPTRYCCYFVTDMVLWYCAPVGSRVMGVKVDGDEGTHRFVRWPDGTIVDVTCDQYRDTCVIRYDLAKGVPSLPAHARVKGGAYVKGVKGPCKRARLLADLLHLVPVTPVTVHRQHPLF